MAKKLFEDLREKYVAANHLTNDFIEPEFGSFEAYEIWRGQTNADLDAWDRERKQRISDDITVGLLPEVEKGSASAAAQLRSLLGLNRPVGRPRGSGLNHDLIESQFAAAEQELSGAYEDDVARMAELEEINAQ